MRRPRGRGRAPLERRAQPGAFEAGGRALLALNNREDAVGGAVVELCREDATRTSSFVEVVLQILNDNSFPNVDEAECSGCLKVFKDIFGDPDTADMMYTNDTNVLLEMVLRELGDLPEKHAMRARFVEVLHMLLLNSSWGEQRFRREEVAKCVDMLMKMGEEGCGIQCQEALEDLLKDCCFLLEE